MKRLVLGAALVAALPAWAGPRDDVVDMLAKCTDVADREARIACYDRAAPQLRAAAGLPPAEVNPPTAPPLAPVPPASPPPASADVAPPAQSPSFLGALDPFGDDKPPAPMPAQMAFQPVGQEILPITIGVTDYAVAPSGAFTVTLANGQVWRERNEHYDTPPFKAGTRNYVTIERGLLGGYNLYLFGNGKLYKVTRVR